MGGYHVPSIARRGCHRCARRYSLRGRPGVWELRLAKPIAELLRGRLTVSVKDRQCEREPNRAELLSRDAGREPMVWLPDGRNSTSFRFVPCSWENCV